MCASQLLLSVDPSLGRIDYNLMSDQTLMEMLIEGFDDETKKTYQDNDGIYLDIRDWSDITFDGDERVAGIKISRLHVNGSLALCYVPPKVIVLEISVWGKSELTGSIDLTCLPDGVQKLYLEYHQFTGSVDLTKLPWKMQVLLLRDNQLTGSLVIQKIPPSMVFMDMRNNHFSAVAVVDSETDATIQLQGSGVTSVVDENGKEIDSKPFL